MKAKELLAIASCKASRGVLRLAGKGGTNMPGQAALSIDPSVLSEVSRGMQIILVTGTNGKTTTCRMLEKAFELSEKKCVLNRSGANLLPGITAEFVCNANWKGEPEAGYAVIECDEATLKQVTEQLKPDVILVTNLFRDQLDRYGEVMNTRKEILTGILKTPDSILCLNADCPLTASISEAVSNPVVFYGIEQATGDQTKRELSDAKYCVHCGTELSYTRYTYAHLGNYICPKCGFRRPVPKVSVTEISDETASHTNVWIRTDTGSDPVEIGLPAVYNVYNALAAVSAGIAVGLNKEALYSAVRLTEAPFGRMESFELEGHSLQMILVKNPAGCNQAMEYVSGTGEDYGIVFCLNDRTADGHDISWIWDADVEKVVEDPHRKAVWVSGTRAEDMQLRLKYGGTPEQEICMEKDYDLLIGKIRTSGEQRVFVLPNYTAMLDLRQALLRRSGGEAFWKG